MRYPAAAGSFYPCDENALKKQIEECFTHKLGPGEIPVYKRGERRIKGCVVPHAGYVCSGPVAAHVYSALANDGFPETFIIIGPNHTGYGSPVALTTESFNTPLGDVCVDKDLAKELLNTIIDNDIDAHRYEHSIEVHLPFLQYTRKLFQRNQRKVFECRESNFPTIKKDFSFVPVCMGMQDYKTAKEVGSIIKDVIKDRDVVVIASSDFTHYEPKEVANRKDKMAIDAIINLDSKKLFEVVKQNNITMCGCGPVMSMIEAVNGKKATLLKYATSGDIQPMNDVVGYAGIIVE
ncbi:MAG: AmmeMemoRadiSam system protein B [Candidatus Thermoplasmatota archaeon]|nr:AmmeMemoRadiSam system protein B [Candidatus Thermoplasmatota archaeon]